MSNSNQVTNDLLIQNMNNIIQFLRTNGIQKQEALKNSLGQDPSYGFLHPQHNLNIHYEAMKQQIIMEQNLKGGQSMINIQNNQFMPGPSNVPKSPQIQPHPQIHQQPPHLQNFQFQSHQQQQQQQQYLQQQQQIQHLQQIQHQQHQQILLQQQQQQQNNMMSQMFPPNIHAPIFIGQQQTQIQVPNILPPPPPPPSHSMNQNFDLPLPPMNLTFAQNTSTQNSTSNSSATNQKSSRWSDSPNPDKKQNARPPVKIESETSLTISLTSKILEDLPVGIMVEVLKKQKANQKQFQPYSTLIADEVPKSISTTSRDSSTVRSQIENFYDFMDREKENDRRQKIKREKQRQLELQMENEEESIRRDQYLKRDFEREIENNYKSQQNNAINVQAGINMDGSTIGMGAYSQRKGLGQLTQDEFSQFRQNRSMKYHVSAEERSIHRDRVELCYKCQRPGHIARDCKFGLT